MSRRRAEEPSAGEYLVYWIYRALGFVLSALPIEWVFRGGQGVGLIGYYCLPAYRKLAQRNIRIAFPEWSAAQVNRCARDHFKNLPANLISAIALLQKPWEQIEPRLDFSDWRTVRREIDRLPGVVATAYHIGGWELCSTIPHWLSIPTLGIIFQGQRNRLINEHIRKSRGMSGMEVLDRQSGFHRGVKILQGGGLLALLVDQHAGDKGVWTPLFGRLASSTPISAILIKKTGSGLLMGGLHTAGVARWKAFGCVWSNPEKASEEEIIYRINQYLEQRVRESPSDWFWLHNRWKTPSPRFLLRNYKRGVYVPADAEPLQPFRMLVRSSNWLGDAVMSVEAVRRIKRGRLDAHLTVLTPRKLAEFWRTVPEVDDVVFIEPGENAWRVAQKLKPGRFDVAILFPNSSRSGFEAWLAGIPRRVGYRRPWRNFLLNQFIPEPDSAGENVHDSKSYLRIAERIGAAMDEPLPEVPRQAAEPRTIGISPGAEYGPAKRWPYFGQAARALADKHQLNWLIFGTAAERELTEEVARQIGPTATNLAGKTSLADLIEQLWRCRLLLTNDTGTMHLAAHLGVPTVAIFGSTEPALTGPIGDRNIVLRHKVECSPCFRRTCPIDFRCMEGVKVQDVVAAVEKLLGWAPADRAAAADSNQ
jgi:lipopolysaccharide heptosyltransferase II